MHDVSPSSCSLGVAKIFHSQPDGASLGVTTTCPLQVADTSNESENASSVGRGACAPGSLNQNCSESAAEDDFHADIIAAYEIVVHWKRNLFNIP